MRKNLRKNPKKRASKDVATIQKPFDFDKAIITIKEARKIIGKKESDLLPDDDLARLIRLMNKIADLLIEANTVPNIKKVL